jgi:choline kinase
MNVIIVGDRFQKRMKSKGCVGLIKVNNKTSLIQDQYKNIKNIFPDSKIIYIYGFDSKRFCSFIKKNNELQNNVVFVYNKNHEQYNTVYSLSLAKDFLNDDCIILFADSKIDRKTFSKFNSNNGSQIFIDNNYNTDIGCVVSNNEVRNISYDLDNKLRDIYYLTAQDALKFRDMVSTDQYNNYFLFEIINKLIDHKSTISPYFITKRAS